MSDTPLDPFGTLGVPTDASDAEIRRAYLRRVREHPPERDPEGFQRIRSAYEAIADETSRARYLSARDHDGAAEELIREAFEAFVAEDHETVVNTVHRVLAIQPHRHDLHELLARALHRLDRDEEALAALDRWARLEPESLLPAMQRGYLHLSRVHREIASTGEPADRARLRAALDSFDEVLHRDPIHADALLASCECRELLDDPEGALALIDRLLRLEEPAFPVRLDAYAKRFAILVVGSDRKALARATEEFASFLPEDDEVRALGAQRLVAVGFSFIAEGRSVPARRCSDIADHVAPIDGPTYEGIIALRKSARLVSEAESIPEDAGLVEPLRRLIHLYSRAAVRVQEELQEEWTAAYTALWECPKPALLESLRNIKECCPLFARERRALVRELRNRVWVREFIRSPRRILFVVAWLACLPFLGIFLASLVVEPDLLDREQRSTRASRRAVARLPRTDVRLGQEVFRVTAVPRRIRRHGDKTVFRIRADGRTYGVVAVGTDDPDFELLSKGQPLFLVLLEVLHDRSDGTREPVWIADEPLLEIEYAGPPVRR